MLHNHEIKFYGTGKIGEKGQIVIPAKARENLAIKAGDDFIFFGRGPAILIAKADQINGFLDKIAEKFSKNISGLREKLTKSNIQRK